MDNICCIILNYNDAPTTISLVEELERSRFLSHIVVVDNCSTDDSWQQLSALTNQKTRHGRSFGMPGNQDKLEEPGIVTVHLMRTERNGGYGMGNQAGINYALDFLEPDYIVVANPDIHVTDGCIRQVRDALEADFSAAIASAMVVSPEGRPLLSYWDLLPLGKELLDTGLITRRLFRTWLATPVGRLPLGADGQSRQVGALPGSFFMIKAGCFTPQELSELFDAGLFLYCEEKVLGQKLRSRGFRALLVTDAFYVHAHSVSIDKSLTSIGNKQRQLHESKLYYFNNYLHAGSWKMMAARAFLAAVLAEVRFLTGVLRMRW